MVSTQSGMDRLREFARGLLPVFSGLVAVVGVAVASPPPAPDEMKYPNIIKPIAQFGEYGSARGQLNEPFGIDVDQDGSIYIADVNNHRIVVLDREGRLQRMWGELGDGDSQLKFPSAVALNLSTGELLVADSGHSCVKVFTRAGKFVRKFGSPSQLGYITGVAANKDFAVVSDAAHNRISFFDSRGNLQRAVGTTGPGDGQFDYPMDVALDVDGNVYVADTYNNRIQKLDSAGRFVKSWGGWGSHAGFFATPTGIRVGDGRVFVSDLINHRIQVFDRDGNYLYQWGRHPVVGHEGNGRIHYPQRVAVAPNGEFSVVCEPFEYRCQVFPGTLERGLAKNVDDSAWWDKATRFHYGTKSKVTASLLAIAEPDTHSVLVFDNTGDQPKLLTKLGGQGREPGKFVRPSGMEIDDESGEIIVSDGGNHRLQVFRLQRATDEKAFVPNVASLVKTVSLLGASPSGSGLSPTEPSAIVRAKDGLFYVADPHNSRVLVLDKNFDVVRTIGHYGTEPGAMLVPSNLELSPDHEILYVVDTYNFRIQAYSRAGKYLFQWGAPGIGSGQFMHAFGIAVDPKGNVYVSDDGANRIQKFDAKGKFLTKWGHWGTEPGQFYKPKGVSADSRGRIFVMNFGNHRAEVFDQEGNYLSMFGIADGYSMPIAVLDRGVTSGASNAGTYLVSYQPRGGPIALNKMFDMEVRIVDSKFRDPAPPDVVVGVDAVMPAHGHGMNTVPQIERTAPGVWLARGMMFHMPGHWRLSVDIGRGPIIERSEFDVMLRP